MQVVMWVILAGTVGLAQLVVVERRQSPIALDAPVRVGPLWVRTPADWSQMSGSNLGAGDLELVDDGNPARQLAIAVGPNPIGEDELGREANRPGAGSQPINFKGLKQTGVLMAWHSKIRPRGGNWTQVDVLLALTQLPSGDVVEIRLTQEGARIGTADAELVKAVANAITWAGPPPHKRRVPAPRSDQTEVD